MTLLVNVGRRVPKSWFRRQAGRAKGLISFQEHIWIIIKQSLSMAKKKADAHGKLSFVMTRETESEDMNYNLEWVKVVIQGTKEEEKEEHEETLGLYKPLSKIFKKDIPKDERMKKHFKTKVLSAMKIEEAYKKGLEEISVNNIANKLLEMGILTSIELIEDYDSRDVVRKPDF